MAIALNNTLLPVGVKHYLGNEEIKDIVFNGVNVWHYDDVNPIITLTSATGITYNSTYTLTATISDPDSGIASVTVNGETVALSGNNLSKAYTLGVGVNTFTVVATDNAGNYNTESISIRYVNSNPNRTDLLAPKTETTGQDSTNYYTYRRNSANELYYEYIQCYHVGQPAGINQNFDVAIPKGVKDIRISGLSTTGFNQPFECTVSIIDTTTNTTLASATHQSGDGNSFYTSLSYTLPSSITFDHNIIARVNAYGNSYSPTYGGGAGGGFSALTVNYYT